jgi:hypothetical protein
MTLVERLKKDSRLKFSFGKADEHHRIFSENINASSMHRPKLGLNIPEQLSDENQLRAVFKIVSDAKGLFVFNINGVDLRKAERGLFSYEEAQSNGFITEWELSIILNNRDYRKNAIFHNGKVIFAFNKRGLLWKSKR